MDNPYLEIKSILSKSEVNKVSNVFNNVNQNEIVLFCTYSEFNIFTGHLFNEIIATATKVSYKCRIRLKKVSVFGSELNEIPMGHKTICQFEFLDGTIPKIIYELPKDDGWLRSDKSLIFR